ncbi:leucyl aminopeptidase family protein [Paenibacillus marinisediminis]
MIKTNMIKTNMIHIGTSSHPISSKEVLVLPITGEDQHPFSASSGSSSAGKPEEVTIYRSRKQDEADVYVVHLGSYAADGSCEAVRRAAGKAARTAQREGRESVRLVCCLPGAACPDAKQADTSWLNAWMEGWLFGLYQFSQYRSQQAAPVKLILDPTDWPQWTADQLHEAVRIANIRVSGNSFARDLVNEPANVLVPSEMVTRVVERFKDTPVQVHVYRGEELKERQMIGLQTIGAGSIHEPAMIELRYAADPSKPLLALIGKGVTFDMGGMNVKSGSDISDARMDMGGAAAVLGAMDILVAMEAKVNVTALIPVVENVPDAKAVLPSAVIRYPNGLSVQIGNTDGEGRLILADALLHAATLGAVKAVDIATLTGNVGAALGLGIAGIWGDVDMSASLVQCGEACGERLWPMPLMDEYEAYLRSDYADINNTSSLPLAGAITAALFIRRFVAEGMKWIHIDMAGTSQYKSDVGYAEAGASGYGARLLADYAIQQASQQ